MFGGMDENWKFVLTFGGGAVVAGIFGIAGAWIADKREHKQWLRNHKVAVYTEFLKQARLVAIRLEETRVLHREAMTPLREANRQISTTAIRIAAPEKVGSASNRVQQAIRTLGDASKIGGTDQDAIELAKAEDHFRTHLNELEDLMREDLKIKD